MTGEGHSPADDPGIRSEAALEQALLRRVLGSGDGRQLHLRFRAGVVDRYRSLPGAVLQRTRSVGRVQVTGRWSLDMGIVDGDATPAGGAEVHVTLADLRDRLPEAERAHWIAHLVPQPLSASFLQMKMAAGACIDDGETHRWE